MPARVEQLVYAVEWEAQDARIHSAHQELQIGDFDCVIDGTTMTARPRRTFATEGEADESLAPRLQSWAYDLELDHGQPVKFRLSESRSIDEETGPITTRRRQVSASAALSFAGSLDISPSTLLPLPTGVYQHSVQVDALLQRWRDLRRGRAKVTVAAYDLFTDLEESYGQGDLRKAADRLNVSRSLLEEVSKLANGRHPTEARKVSNSGVRLTDADLARLCRAVLLLVRRAVAVESGGTELPQLTVADI